MGMSKAYAEGLSTLCESSSFKTFSLNTDATLVCRHFFIAFFDAVATRKNVNFSDKISIENLDRKSDFFDSIRRVILSKIEKEYFSTA